MEHSPNGFPKVYNDGELLDPCYPVISIDENTELKVSQNMGTYDTPVLQVGIERHVSDTVSILRILWPSFKIIESIGFSEEDVHKLRGIVGCNAYACIEASEIGWRNNPSMRMSKEYLMESAGFVVIGGHIHYQIEDLPDANDDHSWLDDECGLDYNQKEECINGRLYRDWIVISKGTNYEKVDMNEIPSSILLTLCKVHHKMYNNQSVAVYNGQVMDKENGWQPIENLGLFAALE